jgi:hypothetical protein
VLENSAYNMKMETEYFSERSRAIFHSAWRYIPEYFYVDTIATSREVVQNVVNNL